MADTVTAFGALPASCDPWLQHAPFQSGRDWWASVTADALDPGDTPCHAVVSLDTRPTAVLPLRRRADGTLEALTTPYTSLYEPLGDPGADWGRVGRAFARFVRDQGQAVLRLDALDPGWAGLAGLLAGAREVGLQARRFDHFGNWHEPVGHLGWDEYLAARPGALRETVRRRGAKAARDPEITLRILTSAGAVEDGIGAYEEVYGRSWKEPEPYPRFNAGLMRRAAERGVLRLGVLCRAGRPLAVQYWIVSGLGGARSAAVLKLAHDETAKSLSPGTLLTAHLIRALLAEGIATLDFGRGDDGYKGLWTSQRSQRIGIILADPRRPAGLAFLARDLAGALRRRWRRIGGKHDQGDASTRSSIRAA